MKNRASILRYDNRQYRVVGASTEPWSRPEVGANAVGIQARYPRVCFTPLRWRFLCQEGVVLAVVPLGKCRAESLPEVPVEIRAKTGFEYVEGDGLAPIAGLPGRSELKARSLYSELDIYAGLLVRNFPPGVSDQWLTTEDARQILKSCVRFEAIYSDKSTDLFTSVEICEPTRAESKQLKAWSGKCATKHRVASAKALGQEEACRRREILTAWRKEKKAARNAGSRPDQKTFTSKHPDWFNADQASLDAVIHWDSQVKRRKARNH